MNRRWTAFRSLLLLAGIVTLGGFQCPRTAPPVASDVQCKTISDGSLGTQTISFGADSLAYTMPTTPTLDAPSSAVLSVRGRPYLSFAVALEGTTGRKTVTAHFGAAISGIREMVANTTDGETFTGTLDGKPLKPFSRKLLPQTFADGSPLPKVTVDEADQKELTTFLNAVQAAPNVCKAKSAALVGPLYADARSGVPYDRFSEGLTGRCGACWLTAILIATWCMQGTISQCSYFGWPGALICDLIGSVACIITSRAYLLSQCFDPMPGPCCPKFCGGNCCGADEACLGPGMSALGLCCPSDHPQACPRLPLGVPNSTSVGTTCCLATDSCDDATATCCPQNTEHCGSQCCAHCNWSSGQCCQTGDRGCEVCGQPGQPCCQGETCKTAGAGCLLNTCVACPSAPIEHTLISTVEHLSPNLFGNQAWFVCQNGACASGCAHGTCLGQTGIACSAGAGQGRCEANSLFANGSVCTAVWQNKQDCSCVVRVDSPADITKSADCAITVTETQTPRGCQFSPPTCAATSKTLVTAALHQGNNGLGTDSAFICQNGACTPPCQGTGLCTTPNPAACDSGFHQGTCSATRTSIDNGSLCTAHWADSTSCSCLVRVQTPSDFSKSVDCAVTVTENQNCP